MKTRILGSLTTLCVLALSPIALAASSFTPEEQPIGYIAPVASSDVKVGASSFAYIPKFALDTMTGDLISARISEAGNVNLLSPVWLFSEILDAQDWDDERFLVTMHKDNIPVPFRKDDMDKDAVSFFKKDEKKRIPFLRGDRSEDGDKFRARDSVLGPIVHSNPVYVRAPKRNYAEPEYEQFKLDHADRPARVYVGSSSGFLHAIDAASGEEVFGYAPRGVYESMHSYSEDGVSLRYGVDGPLVAEDVYFNSAWRTVLVGGLGAGGQGYFALDVTSANPVTNEGNGSTGAGSRVLWDFNAQSDDSDNLGYGYSRSSIVKLNSGSWGVIVSNGYMSDSGRASLYILDAETGSVIRELVTLDSDDNGLSSPSVIDIDFDGVADVAYAGDLNGNLWKFDLTSPNPVSWSVAYSGTPLLVARSGAGVRLPITSAPEIGLGKLGETIVYVATGRLLSSDDSSVVDEQAVYGVRDLVSYEVSDLPLTNFHMLQQNLYTQYHPSRADPVRTASANQPDWSVHKGWRLSLDSVGGIEGERVLQETALRNGRLVISSMNPVGNGQNWLIQVDALTGGAPEQIVYDINRDGEFTFEDNVDIDGNGTIADEPLDRIAAVYTGRGVASRATFAQLTASTDTVLTNRILSIPAVVTTPPGEPGDDDYGLTGGHMDLDVSSQTYPIDGGETDKHDHEWDNEYGNIVDYFKIDEQGGFRAIDTNSDLPGSNVSAKFIINIANAGLSPGGFIEINEVDFPVTEWQAKVRRYLTDTLEPDEFFPVFTLAPTTASENAKGLYTLTAFKTKFFADAILVGGLHPSATGCVKGNDEAVNGEYRNGALTTQLLDASGVYSASRTGAITPVYSSFSNSYEAISFAIHETMNYAVPPVGETHGSDDGLFWESVLFWHWGGGCYSADRAADYADNFEEEVGYEDDRAHDDEPEVGNFYDPYSEPQDPVEPGEPVVTVDEENEHVVPEELSSRTDFGGRLFWREWVPDND